MPAGCCQAWQTAGEWSLAAVVQAAQNPVIILTFSWPKSYSRQLFFSFKSFSFTYTKVLWKMEADTAVMQGLRRYKRTSVSDSLAPKCQGAVKASSGIKWSVNQTYYWLCVYKKKKKRTRASGQMYCCQVSQWVDSLGNWGLTIFGHLSYDVGDFRGARRLGV